MNQERRPPFQVQVNVTVTVPELGPVRYVCEPRVGDVLDTGTINIAIPTLGAPTTAQAWTDPSTGTPYICSQGTLTSAACCVLAKVFKPGVVVDPLFQPDPADVTIRCAMTDPGSSWAWNFVRPRGNLLPLPAAVPTGSGPSTAFTLVVWAKFDGDAKYTQQQLTFIGRVAGQTDCDAPPVPPAPPPPAEPAAVGFPVLKAEAAHEQPTLKGALRNKVGRFAKLPDRVVFRWDDERQGWLWRPDQLHGDAFALLPFQGGLLLHSPVSEPPIIAPHGSPRQKPLRLTFEVRGRPARSARRERDGFVLDVSE